MSEYVRVRPSSKALATHLVCCSLHLATPFDFSEGANQKCAQERERSGVIAGPRYLSPLYPSLFHGKCNFLLLKKIMKLV